MVSTAEVFVGRSDQLAELAAAADAAAGGRPRVCVIEGPGGVGKSALMRATVAELGARFTVVTAEADEFAREEPLAVVRQLVAAVDGAPFAAGLQVLDWLGDKQHDGPVALVVEDLQWADEASQAALLTAVRRLDTERVLTLVTARDDPPTGPAAEGWARLRADPARAQLVTLGGLGADDVAALAAAAGVRLDRRAAKRLRDHTAGSPLHVRTLLHELTPGQLTAAGGDLPAPRSLASATSARVAELAPPAVALVETLAVLGGRARFIDLGRVTQALAAPVDDPPAALDDACATGIVHYAAHDGTVAFGHPLLRAAVYDDLSPRRRRTLHLAAASALGGATGLAHRVAAAARPDESLAAALESNAAAGTDADATARALLSAADLSPDPRDADGRVQRAVSVMLAGGLHAAAEQLRSRVEAAAPGPGRSYALGLLDWFAGRSTAGERHLRDAAGGDHPATRARALLQLGSAYMTMSRGREAADAAAAALAEGALPEDDTFDAWGLLALGRGQVDGAAYGLDDLADLTRGSGGALHTGDGRLAMTRGVLQYYAGQPRAAVESLRAAVAVGQRAQTSTSLGRAQVMLAQSLVILGEWDEALVYSRTAIGLLDDEDAVWLLAQAHAAAAMALAPLGRWDAADRHARAARDGASVSRTVEATFYVRMADAAITRARHDPRGVVAALMPLAGSPDHDDITRLSALTWWPPLVGALVELGELDDAADHVGRLSRAAATRRLDMTARIAVLEGRVAAGRGDRRGAIAAFEAGLAGLGADDPLLERASAHAHYGLVRRAWGEVPAAVEHLAAARDLLAPAGAAPYLDRIVPALQECGLTTPVPRALTPLTPREQDVVTLVAKGYTNREVADALFVSTKAVEYHLGNVFPKLGIRSRRQLRGWAAAD